MTSYIIAGSSDSRETTECETLARNIKTLYSNINFIMILKHPNEWNACIKEICRHYGFKKPSNPIIFTSDGKLIGSTLEFNELAETKFGFRSHMIKERLDHQVNKKIADQDYTERHREKHLIEIIEEKYQEALKNNKISKQTGEFNEVIDHGLVYYVKDTHSTAPVMKIPELRLLEIPIEVIPDVQLDFKEKVTEESILPDSIRPGSQPQDASKKDSKVLSDGDKPKTPAEGDGHKKAAEAKDQGQPTTAEGEEVKQENPENPGNSENPEGQNTETGEEGQPPQEEEQQPQQLEVIHEEDPPEDIPPENPEYPNLFDYVISNIFGDYYLCLHPQPLFEGQCILIHKTEKPSLPKKVEEIKDAKSNRYSNQIELTNHSELDQIENVASPLIPARKNDSKQTAVTETAKLEVVEMLPSNSIAISNNRKIESKLSAAALSVDSKTDQLKSERVEESKSDNMAHQFTDVVKELEEEDTGEKLYTKDFSRTGRYRSRPKKAHLIFEEEEEQNEDYEEENKEKIENKEEENQSYLIRNHSDILTPLSKLDWHTIYKIVRDTDSLAFLQWLPKDKKNYLQLNNEVCHIIPRKFLLLEWKNAGIIGKHEEKGDLLPFERVIHNVIIGSKHELYRGFFEIEEFPFRNRLVTLDEHDANNINFIKLYRHMFHHLNKIYDEKLLDAGVNIILAKKFLLIIPLTRPIYSQNDIPVFPVPMSYIGYILRPQLTDIWPQTAKLELKDFQISPNEIVTRSTQTIVEYIEESIHEDEPEEEEEQPEQVQEEQPQTQEEQPLNTDEQPLNTDQQPLENQGLDPLQDQVQLDGQIQQDGANLVDQPHADHKHEEHSHQAQDIQA